MSLAPVSARAPEAALEAPFGTSGDVWEDAFLHPPLRGEKMEKDALSACVMV